MLGMPATTPYDLRFRTLGIPVRVHPLFWLVMALLGGVGREDVTFVLIFVACGFLSILVHEMGHGLASRRFGADPSILLYGMGGLCYYDGGVRQSPWQRVGIIAAGPGAGLLLCGLTLLIGIPAFGLRPGDLLNLLTFRLGFAVAEPSPALLNVLMGVSQGDPRAVAYWVLIYINFWWSLLNLLPIWPLDGGQLTATFLTMFSAGNGRRWAHVVSLLTAGILAIVSFRITQDMFLTIFFALFALMNFQILQSMHVQSRYGMGGFEEDADWWRR